MGVIFLVGMRRNREEKRFLTCLLIFSEEYHEVLRGVFNRCIDMNKVEDEGAIA